MTTPTSMSKSNAMHRKVANPPRKKVMGRGDTLLRENVEDELKWDPEVTADHIAINVNQGAVRPGSTQLLAVMRHASATWPAVDDRGSPGHSGWTAIRCAGPVTGAEAWIRAGLLAVFLVAGPMAALAAGGWVSHMCAEISARAERVHAVKAVVPQPTPVPCAA